MAWLLLIVALLPIPARGANLVIPTVPARVEMRDVKFSRVSYGFQAEEPGRFQVQVTLRYRTWTSRIERVKTLTFHLQSGTIVQRDDRTLVLRYENREMVVGRHRWWYAPYWQAADGVQITCDRSRRIRRLVLANCRLMVSRVEKRGEGLDVLADNIETRATCHKEGKYP